MSSCSRAGADRPDLPGRVSAFQVSDVRPQVSGVVQRRLFQEGSVVRQGQTLYQIDPSIYQAQAAQAQANLQSARAAPRLRARWPPLQAAGRAAGDLQAGLYQRGRPGAAGRCRCRAEQCGGAQRADQPALHARARADHRPHRPVERHRRRTCHRQPDRAADDDHPPRPGVRRHRGIRPRTCSRSGRRSPRAARPGRPRKSGSSCPTAPSTATPGRSNSARCWSTRTRAR